MVQNRTVVNAADNSGIKSIRCIRVMGSTRRKRHYGFGLPGDIILGSIVSLRNRVSKKKEGRVSDKSKGKFKRGQLVRAVIIRTTRCNPTSWGNLPFSLKSDTSFFLNFFSNSVVILKGDTFEPQGTRIFGPIPHFLKDSGFSKIASLASRTL